VTLSAAAATARLANKKAIKQGVLLPALLDFLSGAEP